MTRYEAYVEKNWKEAGLAHVLVARIRDDGTADFGGFLVEAGGQPLVRWIPGAPA